MEYILYSSIRNHFNNYLPNSPPQHTIFTIDLPKIFDVSAFSSEKVQKMSECSTHDSGFEWYFFVVAQVVTYVILGAMSAYCVSQYRKTGFSFYVCVASISVLEAFSIVTQYVSTLTASFLHDLGAFLYIYCFTLVLKRWILVQLPLNWEKARGRIFLFVILVPNLFSFFSRFVLFLVKLSDDDDNCKAKKIEATLLAVINLLLIFVVVKIARRAARVASNQRALYEVVGFLTICVVCNIARCVIAFLNAYDVLEKGSICCTGQLIVYNSWLEEIIPLIFLNQLMWSVDSNKNQVDLPFTMRRSVSNMHARLLDGREDLMDLLQAGNNTPPPENLWTTPPSSPKITSSTSSYATRFKSATLDECVHVCLEICVEITQERKEQRRRRYCVVLTYEGEDEEEIASTESVRFEEGT